MIEIFQAFPENVETVKDPNMIGSIVDFKHALEKTNLHNFFTVQIKDHFNQRLLLPGIATHLIIEHYIKAITVLKLIDPSTILLEKISEPIKDYLRKREDTLRCIVYTILAE